MNSVPSRSLGWLIVAPNCFESAATMRIPNPRLLLRSKPAGNPTPSSRTDMRAVFSSCRAKRTQMCPLERSEKAYLAALGDKFVEDQGQRNRAIGVELNSLYGVEIELAVRGRANSVRAYDLQVRAKVDVPNVRVIR